jgi:predicted DNA-binding helix-hairpin-helix protein
VTLYEKISVVGPSAKYDTCGPQDFGNTTNIPGVYHAKVGGGHICRLFKVLQTNACKNNCYYCAYRRDRSCKRVFVPAPEMAQAFDTVYKKRLVDGLFLSSGLVDTPSVTMTHILDTANILRTKYEYKGYMHLKLMPGTPQDCIEESLKVADRISINIESPTESDLSHVSPDKGLKNGFFDTLIKVKSAIARRKYYGKRIPSVTTQFIVGAGSEKDVDLIRVTDLLYKMFGLKRVFYSPFRPVDNTPLSEKPPESITRAHRLYQADFLMRFYRFKPTEIPLEEDGSLSWVEDPKMVWAQQNPQAFPMNLNTAGYWDLLKIPGVGPVTAKKILKMRTFSKIRDVQQLMGQRIAVSKLSRFVKV